MAIIKVVGFDPAMRNVGITKGVLDTESNRIQIQSIEVFCPVQPRGKSVLVSAKDMSVASQLVSAIHAAAEGADIVFSEIPGGSQNSRAAVGYGMCIAGLASLRLRGQTVIELTPHELKMASVGKATASKAEIIRWAARKHTDLDFDSLGSKAEHAADAVASIYAGINNPVYEQARLILKSVA